jgi:hypothetical protein
MPMKKKMPDDTNDEVTQAEIKPEKLAEREGVVRVRRIVREREGKWKEEDKREGKKEREKNN